jgi:hypothetical protein
MGWIWLSTAASRPSEITEHLEPRTTAIATLCGSIILAAPPPSSREATPRLPRPALSASSFVHIEAPSTPDPKYPPSASIKPLLHHGGVAAKDEATYTGSRQSKYLTYSLRILIGPKWIACLKLGSRDQKDCSPFMVSSAFPWLSWFLRGARVTGYRSTTRDMKIPRLKCAHAAATLQRTH